LRVEGWLIDCYPQKPDGRGMTFWICEASDGRWIRVKDNNWHAKIYAAGSACDVPDYVLAKVRGSKLVHSIRVAHKRADIYSKEDSPVLEIELNNAGSGRKLGEILEGFFSNPSTFSLYNIDVLPEQQYFYEKELFPLAYVEAVVDPKDGSVTEWHLLDSASSFDYKLPVLKCLRLSIKVSDTFPTFDSKIAAIQLSAIKGCGYDGQNNEGEEGGERIAIIESNDEYSLIKEALEEISRLDPDIIVTQNGDSFLLPFLSVRARKLSISLRELNRDADAGEFTQNTAKAKTYFSYGKIMYRPATQRLFGRLHLDEENTFVYDQCRLAGLYEVSRICRIPLHTAMRASIGKCLSSLQFYYAFKKNILIPWKPKVAEDFKSGYELFLADRGGLVLEPLQGVFEKVAELDFASLYPSIIRKYNISAETVNCRCCRDCNRYSIDYEAIRREPSRNSLYELGLHICKRERGIVPASLELPLDKRFEYKRLRDLEQNIAMKKIFNERMGALKWILVCSFGYLSFRNAKFGKIDSHIAVCAIARKTLLQAFHTAELRGFNVIHGIVDSLWLSKRGAREEHYAELCEQIEAETGFEISLEGIYKWIVFLPSKMHPSNQVANRYFGCFERTNEIKARGIEARRHDTPLYFKRCQNEILKELSACSSLAELQERARKEGVRIFHRYAEHLEKHEVDVTELIIRRRLSKELDAYSSKRQLSVNAALRLEENGVRLRAGQTISYVIARYGSSGRLRSIPEEMLQDWGRTSSSSLHSYDSQRYVELLADCCSTILSPFGVTKQFLLTRTETLKTL
jgi:DNA polymerase I